MVALYDDEERTSELLARLGALGVETSEATIVRVALDDQSTAEHMAAAFAPASAPPVSPQARGAVTGAIVGSPLALLTGLLLYGADLAILKGMFAHALASAIVGAVLGAILGAALAAVLTARRSARRKKAKSAQAAGADGFLVAVKMAPGLAEQAEEIARHLGARKILL